MDSSGYSERIPSAVYALMVQLLVLLCISHTGAQFAKNSYFMDSSSDCGSIGFLLIRSDQVVNINSRRPKGSSSDILRCSLNFKPEDNRNIMDLSFTPLTISDKDVTLTVDLSGAGRHVLSSGSKSPERMTSTGGEARIILQRKSLEDRDYSFGIILRVYREDKSLVSEDEKPVGVGLVVGIVGGIIVFLIFIAVLIVCCYRKKKAQYTARGPDDHKVDLTRDSMTPSRSYGLDNAASNGNYLPREDESPRLKKKPLISQSKPSEYQDHSESESDYKEEPYIMKKYDRSPTKSAAVRYEDERERPRIQTQQRNNLTARKRQDDMDSGRREENIQRRDENNQRRDVNSQRRDENNRRRDENNQRREESDQRQNPNLPPKSPILSALHSNPRFRASFHAAEREAEERTRRFSEGAEDPGSESDYSMTETWNTTFDTNFDDDPRPPQGSIIKPPTLPPVPMSPRSPLRRENTASIRRTPRPSSSSSEIEQLQNGGGVEGGVSMNPEGEGAPSPSEIVAIRVQDPHSPSIKRKADTQHALRPDRSKGTTARRSRKNSPDSRELEPSDSSPKPKKSARNKSQPKEDKSEATNQKPRRSGKPKGQADESINPPKEVKSKAAEVRSQPKDSGTEYEGRFKKSDSVRKSKSKSPRIGRSRSAGAALEDTDSIGQPATPRGYRAVPPVTADDYEDSDMESNYNPLRRTGSKNSLYASRSSLYARRRRKNSIGESVYSFAHDDMDYYRPDKARDSFKDRSLSRHDRGFRSLGDLEIEIRDQENRSTQTLREGATQTGAGFVSPNKRTSVKKSKPKSVNSSQTETTKSRSRNLDSSSSSSGLIRPRERKNSASSTSGRSRSKDRMTSAPPTRSSGRAKQRKNEPALEKKQVEEKERPETPKQKPRLKPKPKSRKAGAGSVGGDSREDDLESVRTGMTGPVDQSSVVGGTQPGNAAMLGQQGMYPPPGYPVGFPAGYPAQMAYMQATGQPPVLTPYGQAGNVPLHTGAVVSNPGAPSSAVPAPGTTPKPSVSKWDMLCKMTDGDSGKAGDSYETGSVAGSAFSNSYAPQYFAPGYSSAMSDYAGSERSGPARSVVAGSQVSRNTRRSAWDALKEMTDQEYQESQYAPSESNI